MQCHVRTAAAGPGWGPLADMEQKALSWLCGSRGWLKSGRLPAVWGAQLHQPGQLNRIVHPLNTEPPQHTRQEGWHSVRCCVSLLLVLSCSGGVCWVHSMSGGHHIVLQALSSSCTNTS